MIDFFGLSTGGTGLHLGDLIRKRKAIFDHCSLDESVRHVGKSAGIGLGNIRLSIFDLLPS